MAKQKRYVIEVTWNDDRKETLFFVNKKAQSKAFDEINRQNTAKILREVKDPILVDI